MALDRPYGDDARGPSHEQPLTAPAGPAEPRTRAEYYQALHGRDGKPVDAPGHGGSGWDKIDPQSRPSVEAVRVSPERRAHILDGDFTGGGHRHGIGSPGKTEFPESWDDEKIVGNILDVAQRPDSPPVHQQWNHRWLCVGTRDDVEISVVVQRDGEIWTAWPEEGSPGVRRNPRKGMS